MKAKTPTELILLALNEFGELDSDALEMHTGLSRPTLIGTLNLCLSRSAPMITRRAIKLGTTVVKKYDLTDAGRARVEIICPPSNAATPLVVASDKPGVSESETTPEASIAQVSSFHGEDEARPENAPVASASLTADATGGDGFMLDDLLLDDLARTLAELKVELDKIDAIANEYGSDAVGVVPALQAMDMLIGMQELQISELKAALHSYEETREKSRTIAAPELYIITAGWREAANQEEALDIARELALSSCGGVTIIARAEKQVTLNVDVRDYPHVPTTQPAAAA